MKNAILALLLLAVVIAGVIFAAENTQNSINGLIEDLNKLPDTPDSDTEELLKNFSTKWNSSQELYSAAIRYDFILSIKKDLKSAIAGCRADDPGTYLSSKNSLITTLSYLKEVQSIRLDNII